jgi:uncharacterized membrane protein
LAKVPEKVQKNTSLPEDAESDDLAQEIAKRIGNIVSHGQKAQIVAQVVSLVTEERFSGPIAHPRHLREYEEIHPGAADRIIRMAEGNLHHAQAVQKLALEGDIADIKAGRLYGFCAFMALMIGAFVLAYNGHEAIAGVFLGAGALGVISQLIQGRNRKA